VAIEDPVLYETLRNSLPFELCDPLPDNTDFSVVTITAYYPEDTELTERLQKIEAELAAVEKRIGKFRFGPALFRHVTEEDWSDEWKQYFHVTRVGKHIVIKPSWEDYESEPEDVVLELDPGMAFGTGTHPTTVLVLEALEKMIRPDTTLFDVGTGSGILAMTAAKLGAKNIKAVDIDGVAVRTAKENIEKAGMQDRIEVRQGDLLHGTEGKADVIVANILADIIIMLLPDIPGKLKEGGLFFASGIIEDYQQDVTEAAEKAGLRVKETTRIKDWVGLLMEKAGKKGTA
jgi:ribosomal protein L11 methyltransferase